MKVMSSHLLAWVAFFIRHRYTLPLDKLIRGKYCVDIAETPKHIWKGEPHFFVASDEVKAILAKSSTDQHKSKIQNTDCQLLCLEVYISPTQLAQILEVLDGTEFDVVIPQVEGDYASVLP